MGKGPLEYIQDKDFLEYLKERGIHPGELNTVGDEVVRYKNIKNGKKLCDRCDGTGNELLWHYRQCQKCGGTGVEEQKA